MKFLKSFGGFWYDFLIGDDWKIAVAVVAALGATLTALKLDLFGDAGIAVLGAVLIVVCYAVSLVIDTRPSKR